MVGEGNPLVHDFIIRNSSTVPVEVLKTSVSCGCTNVRDLAGMLIPPGATINLPVRVETREKSGSFRGTITLYHRPVGQATPIPRDLELHLLAVVKPELTIQPAALDFGTLAAGRGRSLDFTLRARDDREARRFQPTTHDGRLAIAEVSGTEVGARTFRVTFSTSSADRGGRIDTPIAILADGAERWDRRLPCSARVVPLALVEPPSITVGSDVPGVLRRTLVLTSARPLTVNSATCRDDRIHLADPGRPIAPRHEWQITIDPPGPRGSISTKLLLDIEVENDTGAIEAVAVSVPIDRLAPAKE